MIRSFSIELRRVQWLSRHVDSRSVRSATSLKSVVGVNSLQIVFYIWCDLNSLHLKIRQSWTGLLYFSVDVTYREGRFT